MLFAQDPLTGLKGALVQRLGLPIAPLTSIQAREIVDAGEGVGVLFAQDPLIGLEGALVQRLRLPIATLTLIQEREIVDAGEGVGVLFAQIVFRITQCSLRQRHADSVGSSLIYSDCQSVKPINDRCSLCDACPCLLSHVLLKHWNQGFVLDTLLHKFNQRFGILILG